MIDSTNESLLTLAQAADELPRRRRGRKTHTSTLYRWATGGLRGVVLESLKCGGVLCTSREALQRFFERLSTDQPDVQPLPIGRTTSRRLRESEAAARDLERSGA